ncbi:metal tolerance protein 9-like isoform X2 [Punica granatum]|uniref:Metal tolerance protein 9-like isoform X2 n=1 Tax=Punica granatum TaxID=22663 RepID=A0A6P8CRW7_PUNGR|nr:metal tolerance protein 9-like isoform X2 [Punica granatum]
MISTAFSMPAEVHIRSSSTRYLPLPEKLSDVEVEMASDMRTDSTDYRLELLSPEGHAEPAPRLPSWRLTADEFKLPQKTNGQDSECGLSQVLKTMKRRRKIAEYYRRQERLLKGFGEMDSFMEMGHLPGNLTEDEMKQLARSEKVAIYTSNIANMVLFLAKVYASVESRSLAVIASTLDSLLDLLSGFILWFTAHAMRKPNQLRYPIGKERMQPVTQPERDPEKERWMIGIMVSVTIVKFVLMAYCRRFQNDIIRTYAKDHLFDVITNSIGLAAAVLAIRFYWWLDPTGAILIAVYTMNSWARTVIENVGSLIGKTAPAEYIAKLTYLIWNHHWDIKHIATVRAYKCGSFYFVEADIVLPGDMSLNVAHDIGETLQEKLELLPDVERAFVHVDFDSNHPPEHKRPKAP